MLPSRTSGKTQPLEVLLFSVFKNRLQDSVSSCVAPGRGKPSDIFGLYSLIRHAYDRSFTVHDIRASFRRPGIWPLDPMKLWNVPRPSTADSAATILSPEDLYAAFQKRQDDMREELLGTDATSRLIDTSRSSPEPLASKNDTHLWT